MMAGQASRFQAYTRRSMAEKPAKPKAKARREPAGVLGTLPAKRPERLGRPRTEGAKPVAAKRAAKPAARRPKGAPKPSAHGPRAVRPASTPLTSARPAHGPPPRLLGAPTGTELVTTTIRAAGELAQIGLTVGGQVLKRAVDRLPKR